MPCLQENAVNIHYNQTLKNHLAISIRILTIVNIFGIISAYVGLCPRSGRSMKILLSMIQMMVALQISKCSALQFCLRGDDSMNHVINRGFGNSVPRKGKRL